MDLNFSVRLDPLDAEQNRTFQGVSVEYFYFVTKRHFVMTVDFCYIKYHHS